MVSLPIAIWLLCILCSIPLNQVPVVYFPWDQFSRLGTPAIQDSRQGSNKLGFQLSSPTLNVASNLLADQGAALQTQT